MQKRSLTRSIFIARKWMPQLGLGMLVFFLACTSDNQSVKDLTTNFDEDLLTDHWEVDRAFRNGKMAASLAGLYFDFSRTDSLETNMLGQGITESYEIIGDSIKTLGESDMYFVVTKLDSVQLILETNLRATPFQFRLKPKALEAD